MKILKNKNFWIGFVVGTVGGQMLVSKVFPQVTAKLP